MKKHIINRETREYIDQKIAKLALSYTPEWRYHTKNADAGTAMAVIFGDMLYDNQKKLDSLFTMNKISFFNQMNAECMTPKASKGYVTFGLVNENVPGSQVEAGTRVIAQAVEADQQQEAFEITDPLFVTPARLDRVYQVSDNLDLIQKEDLENGINFTAFGKYKHNLSAHEIYIAHDNMLNSIENGFIEIYFYKNEIELLSEELISKLIDENNADIMYESEEGLAAFERIRVDDRKITLYKSGQQPPFAIKKIAGKESCWILFRIKKAAEFKNFYVHSIKLNSYAKKIDPQIIHSADLASEKSKYYPFGEKMGVYQEVLFGSDQVLGKAGAKVSLQFKLEFEKIPLSTNEVQAIVWKWKMIQSDFMKTPEYEIAIGRVAWEYYSETGWNRLFWDKSHTDIFTYKGDLTSKYCKLMFEVPSDIAFTVMNGVESYYIRARVLTMKNEYKTNGYYITPILSETLFHYEYSPSPIQPSFVIADNSMETTVYESNETNNMKKRPLIKQMGVDGRAIYLGFLTPPKEGVIKLLVSLEKNSLHKPYPLSWEYYSQKGFAEMNVTDESENFRRTGIVTFTGKSDFAKKEICKEELYWIRIIDIHNYYENDNIIFPKINGIYLNTTKARACKSIETQYLKISQYESNKKLSLKQGEILSLQLFANESTDQENWVLWEEVSEFFDSGANDRHYMLEPYEGIIMFGDGINGKIPMLSDSSNIYVEYRTGGGENTNIEKYGITNLEKSNGFINQVINHLEFTGGSDREKDQECIKRNSEILKHRNKAVTIKDYEEIAKEASNAIHSVTCFKHRNEYGERKEGVLTLCIVQKSYEKGYLYFEELKEQVLNYLKQRMNQSVINESNLRVAEPMLLKISVEVNVTSDSYDYVFQLKTGITDKINQFLHPLYGNSNQEGFALSQIPEIMQIKNAIYSASGITSISNMKLLYLLCNGIEETKVDLDIAKKQPYFLVCPGLHNITVSIENGGTVQNASKY